MGWLQWLMRINPLTYGVQAIRLILLPDYLPAPGLPGLAGSLGITVVIAALAFLAASLVARGHTAGALG